MSSTLKRPLLGGKADHAEGATITATVVNLLKNMVGAGLLNVCIAFKYSSVLGGVMAMALSAFLCSAGFLLLGYCCSKANAKSFRELWRASMGPDSEKVVDVVLFFHCLFSCVGYITLVGDFAVKSFSGLFPGSILGERRDLSIYIVVVFCIFPLSQLKNLDSLKSTSAIGLFITALACTYVFYDVCTTSSEHGSLDTLKDHFFYLKFDIFKTIALFNGSFSAHYNAPTYYSEMKNKSFGRFAQATLYAFAIATGLFTLFGIAGFARFGDQILGNVLKGYSAEDPMVQVCWLCMMVSTVFVFPHAFQRMRSSWNALIDKPPDYAFQPTTLVLLAITVYIGTAFEDIAVIKMIKGATLGVLIMFIFPALFYIKLSLKEEAADPNAKRRGEPTGLLRILCVVMLISGVGQGILALASHFKLV